MEDSMRSALVALWLLWVFVPLAVAQENRQQAIDNAIEASKQICLVGSRYKFNMDVSGKLTVTKILPGGDLKATVDAANATGGVLFDKEEIRQVVDADIRKCMSEQWPLVLNALDGKRSDTSPTNKLNKRIAVMRELSLPVIYEGQEAKTWSEPKWVGRDKTTITREMASGPDPCRIEVSEKELIEKYFDFPKTGQIQIGNETFYGIDQEKERLLRSQNTTVRRTQYAFNGGEIKTLTTDNWTMMLENLTYRMGAIPVRLAILDSEKPVFSVTVSVSNQRISKNTVIEKKDKTSTSNVELVDTALFLLSSKIAAQQVAAAFDELGRVCDADKIALVDQTDRGFDRDKPPGDLFGVVLEGMFGEGSVSEDRPAIFPSDNQPKCAKANNAPKRKKNP
jgi:hypothetical protein